MRYFCNLCGKSVTTELPNDSIIRAILVCPECIESSKILFPDDHTHITWDKDGNRVVTKIKS